MRTNLLLFSFVYLLAGSAQLAKPQYTPSQIEKAIEAQSAIEHGAQFANQGLGCRTYLWKKSADHHVFFFRRDGVAYGEFRDERLSNGRFISIFEQYLVADSRKPEVLSKAKELRFVCKKTKLVWEDKVWLGSLVHWSFLTTDLNGKILKRDATAKKRMIRGVVSVVVPDHLIPDGETFFVGLRRKTLTPHETAYGTVNSVFEHFGLTNGRCSIWAEWPEDDPEFVVELSQKLPNPPNDATPFIVRTKEIASMSIKLHPPRNIPFVFIPDED